MNVFTVRKPEAVTVPEETDQIGTFSPAPHSYRKWCRNSGGHLFTKHPGMGMTGSWAAILPYLALQLAFRLHDAESVLPLYDGLPDCPRLDPPDLQSDAAPGE